MARVIWSRKALREVESIVEYFLQTSPPYAAALAESLIRSVEVLETFPRLGRLVPDLLDEPTSQDEAARELIVETYRIAYEVQGDTVIVLTVLHGRRDTAAILRALRRRGRR